MQKKVRIIEEQEDYRKAIFRIKLARLRHEKFDGTMTDEIVRLNLDRGMSVAALIHNSDTDQVLLVDQFRYPTFSPDDDSSGWLVELPAGMVDQGEDPAAAIRREVKEEMGYVIDEPEMVSSVFVSPGGSSERIAIFYCQVTSDSKVAAGGGVKTEDEDIQVIEMPLDQAFAGIAKGTINDAKTVLALQWLQLKLLQEND